MCVHKNWMWLCVAALSLTAQLRRLQDILPKVNRKINWDIQAIEHHLTIREMNPQDLKKYEYNFNTYYSVNKASLRKLQKYEHSCGTSGKGKRGAQENDEWLPESGLRMRQNTVCL